MPTTLFWLPVLAFILASAGYLLALRVFPKIGLLDFPERYELARPRLPYPGGIVAVAVFALLLPFARTMGLQETTTLLCVLILAGVCIVDDRTPLPFWTRLTVQVVVALLVFAAGARIYTLTSPFGGIIKLDTFGTTVPFFGVLPILSGLFTLGWLLLTINSLNWFDGIPGQVNVLSGIGFLLLGCLSLFRNGQPEIALLAFVLAGIALAGALFDFPPPKMLLGDTGSMFFGLMLGLLSVYQGGKVATAFIAIGIPLLDALFVIGRRMLSGTSPFRGGNDHLHHRLLQRGWSPKAVVCLTAIISGTFGVSALFMSTGQKFIAAIVLVIVVGGLTMYSSNRETKET